MEIKEQFRVASRNLQLLAPAEPPERRPDSRPGRSGRRLRSFVAKLRHFLASNCEDVEALPQALAENEQLDPRCVTRRRRLLMHEAVQHEDLKMAVDRRLR